MTKRVTICIVRPNGNVETTASQRALSIALNVHKGNIGCELMDRGIVVFAYSERLVSPRRLRRWGMSRQSLPLLTYAGGINAYWVEPLAIKLSDYFEGESLKNVIVEIAIAVRENFTNL